MAKKSRGIQSIEVGGELLRALARSGEPMMLRDLAREAGMAPAKAHPYLVSFSRIGLIEQDETNGRYEIGALALELGLISLRRLSAVRIAAPRIAALASEIDHAVSLAVWGTHGPTVVRLEEPSHPVHIVMRVGSVMAMLETATGRAFAAFLPPKTVNAALETKLDHLGVGYDPGRDPKHRRPPTCSPRYAATVLRVPWAIRCRASTPSLPPYSTTWATSRSSSRPWDPPEALTRAGAARSRRRCRPARQMCRSGWDSGRWRQPDKVALRCPIVSGFCPKEKSLGL